MRVLYSPDALAPAIVRRMVDVVSMPFASSAPATGLALIGCAYDDATVEASDDGFATVLYSNNVGAVSGNLLVEGINVAAASWRVRGAGTFGAILPGNLVNVTDPIFPWSWESSTVSTDRRTMGGAIYSRIHRTQREATWSVQVVDGAQLPIWRNWYATTNGYRNPYVVVDPLSGAPHLVVSPGPFPLSLEAYGDWRGQLALSEVPVR